MKMYMIEVLQWAGGTPILGDTHSYYMELVNIMTLTDSISKKLQDDIASSLTNLVYQNKLNI